MAEDILDRETAVQRMNERMRRRRIMALHKRINVVLIISFALLALLIAASTWVMVSYITPLTLPGSVTVKALVVSDQEQLRGTDFVEGLEGTGISVSLVGYSDEGLGWQDITLKFTRGQEVCTRSTRVYRFHLESPLRVPLGEQTKVTARDFVADESIEVELLTRLEEDAGGEFEMQLLCNGKEYTVSCVVTEDIAPTGAGKYVNVEAGSMPDPKVFVENLQDHSPVLVTYKYMPDFHMIGEQEVSVIITDFFGNMTQIDGIANVVFAENGPQFTGIETIYLQQGNGIAFKSGVKATDAQDGELTFTVEVGNDLDTNIIGRYIVLYSAVDSDGNRVVVRRTVVVESQTGQLLRAKVDQILAQIIKPGMTRDEMIRAVYNYADWNITYIGKSDKSSIENAAYEGLTKKQGDCYTYYSVIRVMLDTLGIPNVECRRVGGTSNHWWNLVQFEDGIYYHVDATTRSIAWFEHFKMTESRLEEYTNNPDVMAHRPNYYVYDHTLPQYQDIEIAQ